LQQDNLVIETEGPDGIRLPGDITKNVDQFDIVIVQFAPLGKSFIAQAENLKLIGVLRGGTENIAVNFATERKITIMNTPGRNARAVAECTIGLILSEIRNIARAHAYLKQNDWRRSFPNSNAIPELYGKTVGLIGYGAVGQLVAGYLQAFGSQIIAYDPFFKGDPKSAELVDLKTLMETSDIVSVHARLTSENYHLVGEKELSWMKPNAVIVNTARSGLIDEQALAKALQENKIQGAALDVFDEEPLPPNHPFIKLDNVTITGHLAGSTIDAFRNSTKQMADQINAALNGQKEVPIVNGVPLSLGIDKS
jgi:D-3-phosphoglycerate dehydrogenase